MPWRAPVHHARPTQRADNRPSAAQRGYGTRWQKARLAFLNAHPLCAECERADRMTPATVVDHVQPHKGNVRLFWDEANWQSLCEHCHNRKSAQEKAAAHEHG